MKNNKMYTVSESDMLDILNMLTYDDYASLQRRLWRAGIKRRPLLTEYMAECKKHGYFESISTDAWYAGYSFIADLFEDNERFDTPCDKDMVIKQSLNEIAHILKRCYR